jgi:DNA adenine methylase
VYFDPPYMPLSSSANFTGYTVEGFGEREQYELKNECDKLDAKGVKFLLSNSEHPLIRELYKKYSIINVEANRTINSIAEKRGTVSEILVTNT